MARHCRSPASRRCLDPAALGARTSHSGRPPTDHYPDLRSAPSNGAEKGQERNAFLRSQGQPKFMPRLGALRIEEHL